MNTATGLFGAQVFSGMGVQTGISSLSASASTSLAVSAGTQTVDRYENAGLSTFSRVFSAPLSMTIFRRWFGNKDKTPPIDELEARAGKGVKLTDLIAYLTSGVATPSEENLERAIELGTEGLSSLICTSQGNREYWDDVLDVFYVQSQFADRDRGLVELATNGIDATRRIGKKKAVTIELKDGEAAVADRGCGMGATDIFTKLIPPSVRDEGERDTIGRFGVGFQSALNYLNTDKDRVIIQTARGDLAHYIFYSRKDGKLRIAMTSAPRPRGFEGTRVIVKSASLDCRAAHGLVTSALSYNPNLPIILNKQRINPDTNLQVFGNDGLRIRHSRGLSKTGRGKVALTVNGVVVSTLPITGSNIPELVIAELPFDTPMPISRGSVTLKAGNIAKIRDSIRAIPEGLGTTTILNALWPLVKTLQGKNPSISAGDDLTLVFKQRTLELLKGKGLFVPDGDFDPDVGEVANNVKYRGMILDPELYSDDLLTAGGVRPYDGLSVMGARTVLGQVPTDKNLGAKPMAVRQGDVIIVNEDQGPKDPTDKAILAAWIETTGGSATLPFSGVRTAREKSFLTRDKQSASLRKLKSTIRRQVSDDQAQVFSHPVLGPLFDDIMDMFMEKDTEHCVSMRLLLNLSSLGTADGLPPDHIPFVLNFARRVAQNYRPCEEYGELVNGNILIGVLLRASLRRNRVLAEKIEGHLDTENARLFRIFLKGVPTEAMIDRILSALDSISGSVPEIEDTLKTVEDMLEKGDPKVGKIFYEGGREMRFLVAKSCMFELTPNRFLLLLLSYAMLYQESFTDARTIESIRRVLEETLDRLGHDGVDPKKDMHNLEVLFGFLKTRQGREIYHSGDWAAWQERVHAFSPLRETREDDIIIADGFVLMDGFLDDFYKLSERYGKEISRDFIYFVNSLASHYHQKKPPADFMRRCFAIWNNKILKLQREDYKRIRDEIYLMFASGADEVYLGICLQPYVSYALGEIENVSELPEATPWVMDGEVESFKLSSHLARSLSSTELQADGQRTIGKIFAERAVAQAINDQSSDPNIFLREFLQNTVDEAARRKAKPEDRRLEVSVARTAGGELLGTFGDPFGMTPETVNDYLLIPGKSTKRGGAKGDQTGRFGQGFFSVFKDAKKVTLRTRALGAPSVEMTLVPARSADGRVTDVIVTRRVGANEIMQAGTTIEVTRDSTSADIDAALMEVHLGRYSENLSPDRLVVKFNGMGLNRPLELVAAIETQFGEVKIYRGGSRPSLTHGGLFVRPLDMDYYSDLPVGARRIVGQNNIVVDLPPDMDLIRDRSDIANKADAMPALRRAIAHGLIRQALIGFISGDLPFSSLPFDLYERANCYEIADDVVADAGRLVSGQPINFGRYLRPDRLEQLAIALPVIEVKGKEGKYSLLELILEVKSGRIQLDDLPLPVRSWMNLQAISVRAQSEAGIAMFEGMGLTEVHRIAMGGTPAGSADAYWAFMELVDRVGRLSNKDARQGEAKYRESHLVSTEEPFKARVGGGVIEWNLPYIERAVNLLGKILRGEAGSADRFEFWKTVISIASHEQTHLFEKTREDGGLTHDLTFKTINRRILEFLRLHHRELDKMLKDLQQGYNGTFVSALEFLDLTSSGNAQKVNEK